MGFVGLVLMSLLAVASPARAGTSPTITVMTRNVYYGADVRPLAVAAPGAPFQQAATKIFTTLKSEDPNGRMKLVAGEIAKAKPDVVGLQELAVWRTGPAPASKVAFNFLALITSELKRLHQPYRVVAVESGLNVEGSMTEGDDMRLTLQDAVLARSSVKTSHARSALFAKQLLFPTLTLGQVPVNRGYNQLDVTKQGVTVHVVNTHLEAFATAERLAQANELIAGPLQSTYPTILIGDLNSGPNLPKPDDRPPYLALAAAGFVPTRTTDFNCCYKGVTDTNQANWDHIVDWILSKPALTLMKSYTTGIETTAAGVHPGDHGGVVSVVKVSS